MYSFCDICVMFEQLGNLKSYYNKKYDGTMMIMPMTTTVCPDVFCRAVVSVVKCKEPSCCCSEHIFSAPPTRSTAAVIKVFFQSGIGKICFGFVL